MTVATATAAASNPSSLKTPPRLECLPNDSIGKICDFLPIKDIFAALNRVCRSCCQAVNQEASYIEETRGKTQKVWEVILGGSTECFIPSTAVVLITEYAEASLSAKAFSVHQFVHRQLSKSFSFPLLQMTLSLNFFDILDLPTVDPMNRILRPAYLENCSAMIPSELVDAERKPHAIIKMVSQLTSAKWSILIGTRNKKRESYDCYELLNFGGSVNNKRILSRCMNQVGYGRDAIYLNPSWIILYGENVTRLASEFKDRNLENDNWTIAPYSPFASTATAAAV